jgi:hypothetical protein
MTPAQQEYVKALVKAEVALAHARLCAEIAVLRAEHCAPKSS